MYGKKNYRREYENTMKAMILVPILMKDITLVLIVGTIVMEGGEFWRAKQESRGRLSYNSIKIISFFPSNSYLCFEIYFKEIKLFSLGFIEHRDHFTFLKSLGTDLERRYFIGFNPIYCAIPRVDDYDFNSANCVSYVLGVEDRRSMGKEFGPILEDLSISLSLNPFSLCYDVSLEELKWLVKERTESERLDCYCVRLIHCSEGLIEILPYSAKSVLLFLIYFWHPNISVPLFHKSRSSSFENGRLVFRNCMIDLFTCELVVDIDHTLKYAFLEKQLLTLVDKHDALFAYPLLSLECLDDFHSIVPFNAPLSNIARVLWFLRRMDSRTNSFKGRADGMTRDTQETVELLQGQVTRAMARRMEEEHQRKIVVFEKMIEDSAWQK
ncbi:hypothetical protein M9H77_30624 [Catharanthus roseus]|uniref:Uncharacterized protein n=1 Tax=Catharanthus roseus TaxID=4058 RepID=A0ACB9ZZ31_CATRO|nr:hypothetical protein M9H77_30624 [Catharanthus roseus]